MNNNKDLNYAFAISRPCLWILGVWPCTPLSDFRRPNIRFVIVVFILSFYVIIPQLTNVVRAWDNVARMMEHVASANFSLMALYKLITTWYHGEALRTLITSVMTDWVTTKSDWERSTMLKIAGRGRSLSFRCYVSSMCTIAFNIWINVLKFQRNMHQHQWILAYPYNIQKSPNYEMAIFTQVSGSIYSVLINCTVDSFISIFLLHVCAQLINLRTTLYNIVDKMTDRTISSMIFKEGLAAIALRHEHLIRNVKTINDCYSGMLFLQILSITFQLCFQSFQLLTIITDYTSDIPVIKIIFLFFNISMVLTHFYIYCYSAEKLITESTGMAYGVYQCKWYDLPPKNAKDLMIIVYRSNIPLRLFPGGRTYFWTLAEGTLSHFDPVKVFFEYLGF